MSMSLHPIALRAQDFTWALGSLSQIHRLAFDRELLLQQAPPPYTLSALVSAAQALGLHAGVRQVTASEVHALPLPCLALLNAPATELGKNSAGFEARHSLALIIKADTERVVLFTANSVTPTLMSVDELDARFAGQVILATPREQAASDVDPSTRERKPFGFNWFAPEIFKHKRIFRDVLAASLVIQLLALATPLFTQVIIDKVVVHHTLSTLAR
jgi:subfamily B ATP-binding cassette protein HlyB/CyaB